MEGTSVVIAQTVEDRRAEADQLLQIGVEYYQTSQFPEALTSWQTALEIYRKTGDRTQEGVTLSNLGNVYLKLSQYQRAISLYEQAIAIAHEVGDRVGEGINLGNLGIAYDGLGQYQRAISLYEQRLAIAREIGDRVGESSALKNLGSSYTSLSQYQQAISVLEQAIDIAREIGDRHIESQTLGNLGNTYLALSQYQQAADYYEQRLDITREVGDRAGEADTLGNLGIVYRNLNQHQQAIDLLEQTLAIAREVGNRYAESRALGNLGNIYSSQGLYQDAITSYEQHLVIAREIGDRSGEANALGNLGNVYFEVGLHQSTVDLIANTINTRLGESETSYSTNNIDNYLDQYQQVLSLYEQQIAIYREIGNQDGEGIALNNVGSLYRYLLGQADLAITFYKQSVNVREQIRSEIQSLPIEDQQAYTRSIEYTYRGLANLLLKQGRILEAQRVLELLKVEEIRDYTRNQRAVVTSEGIRYTPLEEEIIREHDSLIAFGQRINQCEQENCPELEQLYAQRRALTDEYNNYIETVTADIRANRSEDDAFYDPRNLSSSAREIVQAQPGTMLIYPLVLEDKLWLLWVAPNGIANRVEVPVTQVELGDAALQFRQLLDDPSSDLATLQDTAQKLYTWLIEPLEAEIEANQIQNLVFSLDRVTRYIPMAALFDGEQYLVERFTLSTILSAELTDMRDLLSPEPQSSPVLAMGVSEAKAEFDPLPFVEQELDEIVRLDDTDTQGVYPGSVFLNDDFNLDTLDLNLPRHAILHLATHAKFEPGIPEESYLLMGNGEPLSIDKIDTLYNLTSVNMVVLSACETALGGPDAEGLEIAGLGFHFLNGDRASTLIASLWQVNDASTSQLMQRFYQNLASNTATAPMTKAEALRQAQLSLLQSNATTTETGNRFLIQSTNSNAVAAPTRQSHPYYWAPFVLIGNHL